MDFAECGCVDADEDRGVWWFGILGDERSSGLVVAAYVLLGSGSCVWVTDRSGKGDVLSGVGNLGSYARVSASI